MKFHLAINMERVAPDADIPGAEAAVLPGLRHMGLAENPLLFNGPLVDFLSRTVRVKESF